MKFTIKKIELRGKKVLILALITLHSHEGYRRCSAFVMSADRIQNVGCCADELFMKLDSSPSLQVLLDLRGVLVVVTGRLLVELHVPLVDVIYIFILSKWTTATKLGTFFNSVGGGGGGEGEEGRGRRGGGGGEGEEGRGRRGEE